MAYIKYNSDVNMNKTLELLDKFKLSKESFNIDVLNDDIERIKKIIDTTRNKAKLNKANLTLKYLLDIKQKINTDVNLEIKMFTDGKKIFSKPIDLKKIDTFNILGTDYINISNKNLMVISYRKLINALAFDASYLDLGVTLDEVEKELEELGIINIYPDDKLNTLLDDIKYEYIMSMIVGETTYTSVNRQHFTDYFGDKVKNTDKYSDIIRQTSNRIMTIIVDDILNKAKENNIEFKIAAVHIDSIAFVIDKEQVKKVDKLNLNQVVQIFGRKFEFKPEVEIY